jgi:hypothetical protein
MLFHTFESNNSAVIILIALRLVASTQGLLIASTRRMVKRFRRSSHLLTPGLERLLQNEGHWKGGESQGYTWRSQVFNTKT